jgi:hypothetical protein
VGENTAEETPSTGRSRKRVLILALLLIILSIGAYYYVLPRILGFYNVREDPVPLSAYVVPWMQPGISTSELNDPTSSWRNKLWDIDMIMSSALKLNITFTISVPNGTRVIPTTIYLGHDTDYLYVGGKFTGIYRNPADTENETFGQYFAIYFDADNDGKLSFPESGSRYDAGYYNENIHPSGFWGCDDMIWGPDVWNSQQQSTWESASNYFENQHASLSTQAATSLAWEYDNSTGTWSILFSRYLLQSSDRNTNAFMMRSGERWVVGFNLEIGYFAGNIGTDMLCDGWPQTTYPYLTNDASSWPKLAIDLGHPPTWLLPQT